MDAGLERDDDRADPDQSEHVADAAEEGSLAGPHRSDPDHREGEHADPLGDREPLSGVRSKVSPATATSVAMVP